MTPMGLVPAYNLSMNRGFHELTLYSSVDFTSSNVPKENVNVKLGINNACQLPSTPDPSKGNSKSITLYNS